MFFGAQMWGNHVPNRFFLVILRTFWCFDRDLSEFAGCIHKCGNPNLGNSPNQSFLRRLTPHLRRLIW
jgi:hypothetical protein